MLTWLAENWSTILVLAVVGIGVFFAARSIYKARKKGGCSGCSGECQNCGKH